MSLLGYMHAPRACSDLSVCDQVGNGLMAAECIAHYKQPEQESVARLLCGLERTLKGANEAIFIGECSCLHSHVMFVLLL